MRQVFQYQTSVACGLLSCDGWKFMVFILKDLVALGHPRLVSSVAGCNILEYQDVWTQSQIYNILAVLPIWKSSSRCRKAVFLFQPRSAAKDRIQGRKSVGASRVQSGLVNPNVHRVRQEGWGSGGVDWASEGSLRWVTALIPPTLWLCRNWAPCTSLPDFSGEAGNMEFCLYMYVKFHFLNAGSGTKFETCR